MKQIYANNFTTLALGRKGENLASQVVFDVRDLESLYGPGDVEVIYQRPGDAQPYPQAVQRDGTLVTWDVTATDTEMSNAYGKCELRYYVGETLAKSKIWRTWVEPALPTPSETAPPEPEKGWVDQIIAVGAAAKASADAAKADADRAAALAAQAAEKAAQTAQDASKAAKAMEAAQTAQRLAEEAQGAAEAAMTAAAAAQAAAETAATDAAGAKKDAETAQKAAQDAAAAAANTLESIQTLYQEMQTWAQGVIQDVNDAGSVAVRSVQTTGDAQVQRVTAEGTRQTANAKAQADAAAQSASGAAQSAQQAAESASAASTSKTNAKASEESAKASETAAQASQTAAAGSASAAANSATSASASASAASESASAAAASATAAKASEEAAKASETAAKASETAAAGSASAAQQSATSAAESAAVYGDVVEDVTQLKQDLDAIENGSQNYIVGYGFNSDGTLIETEGVSASDFIPVNGSTMYISVTSSKTPSPYKNIRVIEYTEDKSFVDYWGSNPSKDFLTNVNTRFVRFSFDTGYEATLTEVSTSRIIYKATHTESLNSRIDTGARTVISSTNWDNTIPTARHNPDTNYIDLSAVTNGYISENGIYVPYNSLRCTDYIPMIEEKTYYRGIGIYSGKYYAFYDESKNVVASGSSLGDLSQPFTVPIGAVYGRFTVLKDVEDIGIWISDKNAIPAPYEVLYYFGAKMSDAVKNALTNPSNPTDYDGMDIQAFDTCVCIGDSLTEGVFNYDDNGDTGYSSIPSVSFPSALKRMTGIDVDNLGVSGSTSLEWLNLHQNTDLSGHKFAIVQFGVNDKARYGGWTQNSIDGYTGIINKLKADNPKIKIFVSTVIPATSYPPSRYEDYNTALKAFVASLNDTDVILLDLATYGNTMQSQYNAGHLSAYGYWRLAKDYTNYISWYMHNNGIQFREIQFIGTDKHYYETSAN